MRRAPVFFIAAVAGVWFLATFPIYGQPEESHAVRAYLESLSTADPLYQQHQLLLQDFHRRHARGEPVAAVLIMRYTPRAGETLFSIAARLSLPYSAVATLNGMSTPALPAGDLLIPTQPGIFLRLPREDGESLPLLYREMARRLADHQGNPVQLRQGETLYHFPGMDFSPGERAGFLAVAFTHPLPSGRVSSPFGYRTHPITGRRSFHQGVDFVAPFGTPVTSAADGVVRSVTRDRVLGLMVTIDHRDGYTTRYAHLQESMVRAGDGVAGGAMIGRVGSTGISTGPHLHFEIRREGVPRDPQRYLP